MDRKRVERLLGQPDPNGDTTCDECGARFFLRDGLKSAWYEYSVCCKCVGAFEPVVSRQIEKYEARWKQ